MQTPLSFKDYPNAVAILMACGYEQTKFKSFNVAFLKDQLMVVMNGQQVIILEEHDNDEFFGKDWKEIANVRVRFAMSITQFISLLEAFGVISYNELINKAADIATLSEKRALWHVKEALRRCQDQENIGHAINTTV